MALLQVTGLTKHFGGLAAVDDLHFHVKAGEIVGLIGPNGAGKTTVLNMVTGFIPPTKGIIAFDGHTITNLKPHSIVRLGLARTFQNNLLFKGQTVLENIMGAGYLELRSNLMGSFFNTHHSRSEEGRIRKRAVEVSKLVGLTEVEDRLAEKLPHGFQRLLGLAMAYSVNPKLMLLDEPTGGMNADESIATVDLLQRIRKEGTTILLIEHNMKVVMNMCTRILVLDFGKLIAEGLPEEISKNSAVIKSYLGEEIY